LGRKGQRRKNSRKGLDYLISLWGMTVTVEEEQLGAEYDAAGYGGRPSWLAARRLDSCCANWKLGV